MYTLLLAILNKQYNNQGYGKTENSGGANALILKNIGAKLRKKVIFGTILLTFFQKLEKESASQHLSVLWHQ